MKNINKSRKQDLSITKMKFIKTLACKFMISAKRLSKRLWSIFTDVFATIGVLVMIAEAASDVFNYQGLFGFYRTHIWSIVAIILIGCVWKNWDRLKYTVKIANSSDITITLRVRDALKNKGAIIIPTNSTFDTVMEDEFISEGSLQGQYQMKYFRGRIPELDTKILEGLTEKKYVVLNDGRKHNSNRYPIGTVSRVNDKTKGLIFLLIQILIHKVILLMWMLRMYQRH